MKKGSGKGFASIEGCVDVAIHRLKEYINKSKERLINVASYSKITIIKSSKQKWEENYYIDTSRDKLRKLYRRWPG